MLAGTALYIRLLVYAGLSLFIISGLYVYMVVCVVYTYNLTLQQVSRLAYGKAVIHNNLFNIADHNVIYNCFMSFITA